jgi:hypothetical protein
LEAEFGIPANSVADADYRGWELKSLVGKRPEHIIPSKSVTVITPNPEDGYFATHGVEAFIRRYGYPDQNGVPDRLNVGGISSVTQRAPRTGLIMALTGFVPGQEGKLGTISDLMGGSVDLVDEKGRVAAAWPYPKILAHWERKHAMAVYVPVMKRRGSGGFPEFHFGCQVWLGVGTDFIRFLTCIGAGLVFQDPGHKLEGASSKNARAHSRSQFRIKWANLPALYASFRKADVGC